MNKYYGITLVVFFFLGATFSWYLLRSKDSEEFSNQYSRYDCKNESIHPQPQCNNCSDEKISIDNLTDEIERLTGELQRLNKLNTELTSKLKEASVLNINKSSIAKNTSTTKLDASVDIEMTNDFEYILDEKDTYYSEQDELNKRLINTNWEEKPEELANMILSFDSTEHEMVYTALTIAQEGFGHADDYKINEVNLAFAEIYSQTKDEELKSSIVRYLSNIEPNLIDSIYKDFSDELYSAINEYIEKTEFLP